MFATALLGVMDFLLLLHLRVVEVPGYTSVLVPLAKRRALAAEREIECCNMAHDGRGQNLTYIFERDRLWPARIRAVRRQEQSPRCRTRVSER